MEKRKLKNIKDEISLLGFGLMRLPKLTVGAEDIDYQLAEKMIDYAYQNGVNYFDTAWVYHDGKSESFVGDVLGKYDRKTINIASKCPVWLVKKESDVLDIFNKQLAKCNLEYFDFYLLHALNRDSFQSVIDLKIYDTLLKLKKEGKIRYLGFSFHDKPFVLQKIVDTYEFDFAQIQLNYVDWEDYQSKEQYEILRKKDLPIIIMEPVKGGTLATLNDEAYSILNNANPNHSVASYAIRYALSKEGVLTVLSGMSNFSQVSDNIKTVNNFKKLDDEELLLIEKAKRAYLASETIGCTNCRYCMPCSYGVDIPQSFKIYNDYRISSSRENFILSYQNMLDNDETHKSCVECGMCVSVCPQGLEIPKLLKKVGHLYDTLNNE